MELNKCFLYFLINLFNSKTFVFFTIAYLRATTWSPPVPFLRPGRRKKQGWISRGESGELVENLGLQGRGGSGVVLAGSKNLPWSMVGCCWVLMGMISVSKTNVDGQVWLPFHPMFSFDRFSKFFWWMFTRVKGFDPLPYDLKWWKFSWHLSSPHIIIGKP